MKCEKYNSDVPFIPRQCEVDINLVTDQVINNMCDKVVTSVNGKKGDVCLHASDVGTFSGRKIAAMINHKADELVFDFSKAVCLVTSGDCSGSGETSGETSGDTEPQPPFDDNDKDCCPDFTKKGVLFTTDEDINNQIYRSTKWKIVQEDDKLYFVCKLDISWFYYPNKWYDISTLVFNSHFLTFEEYNKVYEFEFTEDLFSPKKYYIQLKQESRTKQPQMTVTGIDNINVSTAHIKIPINQIL
jgi:hypothetical protein